MFVVCLVIFFSFILRECTSEPINNERHHSFVSCLFIYLFFLYCNFNFSFHHTHIIYCGLFLNWAASMAAPQCYKKLLLIQSKCQTISTYLNTLSVFTTASPLFCSLNKKMKKKTEKKMKLKCKKQRKKNYVKLHIKFTLCMPYSYNMQYIKWQRVAFLLLFYLVENVFTFNSHRRKCASDLCALCTLYAIQTMCLIECNLF